MLMVILTLDSILTESDSRRTDDMTAIKSRAFTSLFAAVGSDMDDESKLVADNSTNI